MKTGRNTSQQHIVAVQIQYTPDTPFSSEANLVAWGLDSDLLGWTKNRENKINKWFDDQGCSYYAHYEPAEDVVIKANLEEAPGEYFVFFEVIMFCDDPQLSKQLKSLPSEMTEASQNNGLAYPGITLPYPIQLVNKKRPEILRGLKKSMYEETEDIELVCDFIEKAYSVPEILGF